MLNYKIWNKADLLITPQGKFLHYKRFMYNILCHSQKVLSTILQINQLTRLCFTNLNLLKIKLKQQGAEIVNGMTDQEVLDAITAFENRPIEVFPTPEERMAAALDLQAAMAIPPIFEEVEQYDIRTSKIKL